jgi:hypothetical protein
MSKGPVNRKDESPGQMTQKDYAGVMRRRARGARPGGDKAGESDKSNISDTVAGVHPGTRSWGPGTLDPVVGGPGEVG